MYLLHFNFEKRSIKSFKYLNSFFLPQHCFNFTSWEEHKFFNSRWKLKIYNRRRFPDIFWQLRHSSPRNSDPTFEKPGSWTVHRHHLSKSCSFFSVSQKRDKNIKDLILLRFGFVYLHWLCKQTLTLIKSLLNLSLAWFK